MACQGCGYQPAISYNSCRHWHCPKCQWRLGNRSQVDAHRCSRRLVVCARSECAVLLHTASEERNYLPATRFDYRLEDDFLCVPVRGVGLVGRNCPTCRVDCGPVGAPAIIPKLSPWLLRDTLPLIRPRIQHVNEQIKVELDFPDCQKFFKANLTPAPNGQFRSKTFGSLSEFSAFIHNGVTSYAVSIYGDALTKVDLIKEDPVYEPQSAEVDFSWLDSTWRNANLELDSAVRAHGGRYQWKYRGLKPLASEQPVLRLGPWSPTSSPRALRVRLRRRSSLSISSGQLTSPHNFAYSR